MFGLLHKYFPLPPSAGNVNFIHRGKAKRLTYTDDKKVLNEHRTQEALYIPPAKKEMDLQGETPYKASTTRQIPLRYQAKAEAHIADLIKKGRIAKVTEPNKWCSHTFFVPKPGGNIHLVTDLSPVNRHIRTNTENPADSTTLNIPESATCFATINIANGRIQIPLDGKSSKLTTFLLPSGAGTDI